MWNISQVNSNRFHQFKVWEKSQAFPHLNIPTDIPTPPYMDVNGNDLELIPQTLASLVFIPRDTSSVDRDTSSVDHCTEFDATLETQS